MMFVITALDNNQQQKDFFFQLERFEDGLDFASNLITEGAILLEVLVTEPEGLIVLPVSAFDGSEFSIHIQQLETEWKAILDKPAPGRMFS